MQLETVIAALRARCLSFGSRVAGAGQFKLLPEAAALAVPCAFVIPLDDTPGDSLAMNSVRQELKDSFAVIVAVSNVDDERGQGAAHSVNALRAELWSALLGWRPELRYDGITYEGGQRGQMTVYHPAERAAIFTGGLSVGGDWDDDTRTLRTEDGTEYSIPDKQADGAAADVAQEGDGADSDPAARED